MEDTLRAGCHFNEWFSFDSLNPYSNGRYSESKTLRCVAVKSYMS